MGSNRITELSGAIAENSKVITDYLAARNLPAPSFDVDGLTELAISPADPEAFAARSNLIAATKELHDLVLGPKEHLRHLAWDVKLPNLNRCIKTNHCANSFRCSPSTISLFMPYITLKSLKPFQLLEKSATPTWQRKSTPIPSTCAV